MGNTHATHETYVKEASGPVTSVGISVGIAAGARDLLSESQRKGTQDSI